MDAAGNAYITGGTASADFPIKNAFQKSLRTPCTLFGPCGNAFVTKLDAAGSGLIYSTYLGGSNTNLNQGPFFADQGVGIAVDSKGSAYVTGRNRSSDFPIKNAFQSKPAMIFVSKLEPAGDKLAYSTYIGGSSSDQANGIAVDANGSAYITGVTHSSDFPVKNPFQSKGKNPNGSAFVTKFDAAGTALVYSTYLSGSGGPLHPPEDQGNSIAVDGHGNAYVTGYAGSSDFPLKNAFQKTFQGDVCAFVTKFDAAGTALVYSTYLGGGGGPFTNQGNAIAVDMQGNAYIAGYTQSPLFPLKNAFQKTLNSYKHDGSCSGYYCGNAFVTKFATAGQVIYSSYLGGSFDDTATEIGVDTEGNAWLAGVATSHDFPTKDAIQPVYGGGPSDGFVTKISAK